MDYYLIKDKLQLHLLQQIDLDQYFQDFCESFESDNVEKFLYFLKSEGLIEQQCIDLLESEQETISTKKTLQMQNYLGHLSMTHVDQEETLLSSSQVVQESANTNPKLSQDYTILSDLAEGAMGKVQIARDNSLQRKIAVKSLHENLKSDRVLLNRFFNEIQITAQLDHPFIVPIYGLLELEQNIAYSMKLIKGQTLKDLLAKARKKPEEEKLSIHRLLEHYLKLCDAVDFAHNKGVIHRDLKPENIMIGDFHEVYLMDWGIARVMDESDENDYDATWVTTDDKINTLDMKTGMTSHEDLIGTPGYMSPEQIADPSNVDPRSDVYALGVILYEIAFLKPPFKAKDLNQLLKNIVAGKKEPLVALHSERKVSYELQGIINKAMDVDAEERYENVAALSSDIRKYIRGFEVVAVQDNLIQKIQRWMMHNRQKVLTAFLVLICLSTVMISWSIYQQQAQRITAQHHEKDLNQLLLRISNQSQTIDGSFLQFEILSEKLASNARQLYLYASKAEKKISIMHEDPIKSSIYSKRHKTNIILEPFFATIPLDSERKLMKQKANQMGIIYEMFQQLFFQSAGLNRAVINKQKIQEVLLSSSTPLAWTYVGFEDGLFLEYPGVVEQAIDFDHRQRPWYMHTKQLGKRNWYPYIATHESGIILACQAPIYDQSHQFLGVASTDFNLNYVLEHFLKIPLPGVKESYILNEKGEVVLSSNQQQEFDFTKTLQFKSFPHQTIVESIQAQKSGYQAHPNYPERLLVYHRMKFAGWYYVVDLHEEKALNSLIR